MLVLILSSFITSSTTASIQSFTVSESVNGLFFFANIQETRRDAAVALSWAVNGQGIFWQTVCQLRLAIGKANCGTPHLPTRDG